MQGKELFLKATEVGPTPNDIS